MATVAELLDWVDETYPFALAEDYDNCGLLLGSGEQQVSVCAVALDVTADVLSEAIAAGAQLIVTHHPVIFTPVRNVLDSSVVYDCVRASVAVISSHTCLDKAVGGVNDTLCVRIGLQEVCTVEDGLLRRGVLPEPVEPRAFARLCKERLGSGGVRVVAGNRPVRAVGVCSGAGGSFVEQAAAKGLDALLTGEVKHHEAVAARHAGITLVDAGHFETETVVVPELIRKLSDAFPDIRFFEPEANRPLMEWL